MYLKLYGCQRRDSDERDSDEMRLGRRAAQTHSIVRAELASAGEQRIVLETASLYYRLAQIAEAEMFAPVAATF